MKISLERLFSEPPITGADLNGLAWHPDGTRFTYLQPNTEAAEKRKDLWAYELETGERTRLVEGRALKASGALNEEAAAKVALDGYQWFPDGRALLLSGNSKAWRYDLETASLSLLIADLDDEVTPHFSPTGERLAFVRGGNLHILTLANGEERALTFDGSTTILNGKLDWVYWEELAHRSGYRAFEWSPDGKKIALLRLDQSRVPEYPLVDTREVHPRLTFQRYPKAGDPNSTPSLLVVDAEDGRLLAEECHSDDRFYLGPHLAWTPDSTAVTWTRLARDQRSLELLRLEVASGENRVLVRESDPHWLNRIGPAFFLPDGSGFLWVSEETGRANLYRHDPEGERQAALMPNDWQVEEVHGIHGGAVYLSGIGTDPRERHLYRLSLEDGAVRQLTTAGGVHRANVQESGQWALVHASTPEAPTELRLLRGNGEVRDVIHRPDPTWKDYSWAEAEYVDLTAPDGTLLHACLIRPPDFDPAVRYPVVVHVYGGPHAQTVRKSWAGADPLEQLLAQAGVLVWRLDNRGSWGRGHAFETPVDRHLGTQELADQLTGVDYLRSLPYVDPERIGITGWSYGGYLTLYALTHAPEVWRCGVAGAPVTDWKLYDSVYTERYMGTPSENPQGYEEASVLTAAGELQAPLLLIHGTDDDNVHLQQTLQLTEALMRHRKSYELLVQPGQKHGFRGSDVRIYLHERILEFFMRHFGLSSP